MKKSDTDKIDILMNKIQILESSLNVELKLRMKCEEELSTLKTITLPSIQSELDEKEKKYQSLMISNIQLQKENNYLKEKFPTETLITTKNTTLTKIILPEYQDEKDKLILSQSNKIDYLTNAYKDLRLKLQNWNEDSKKSEKENSKNLETQKSEITALQNTNTKNDATINELNSEITILTKTNNNLLIEIKTLNTLVNEYTKEKEQYQLQANYYKKENQIQNVNLLEALSRVKQLDNDYQSILKISEDYKTKISELDTKTYIFSVMSVGRVIDNSAELLFNKEGRNQYGFTVKYITSSSKYDILEIESIAFVDGDDTAIIVVYKNKGEGSKSETFRTQEGNKIIRVFKDFQNKAIQHLDVRKQQKDDRLKQKQIKKNVNELFSMFGN